MKKSPRLYTLAKILSILLTGITNVMLIFGVLSLYDNFSLFGVLIIFVYVCLLMFDTYLCFWIWEQLRR